MSSLDLGTVSGKVDLDVAAFDRKYAAVDAAMSKLEAAKDAEVRVDADTDGATRKLDAIEAFTSGVIDGMAAEINVAADTSRAEQGLDDVADKAGQAGDKAGDDMGQGMVVGILAGLASIPIAGAVVKVGQAIAGGLLDGIQDGLAAEATRDMFSARTGLDEATAERFARAAGNAYGSAFGESVESNLDIARQSLQLGLIDADDTNVEIEKVIAKITSLSDIAEEDARRIATSVDVMVSSGIVKSADEAFDVLTRGFQKGVDSGEDLLDTMIEYPALFARLGLDADEAMGLMNQGLEAGARNSDFVADALKEFQIRATDASEASATGFERIGLNAEEMTAKIAKGGEGAKEGLDQVLDGLRAMEDPVARNQAGVELFGTKWEDLGDAMLALDVGTAVSSLGEVEGALDNAMTALADNPATAIETAKRQIELSADGIKAALASAFGEPLTELSDWVQGNRAGVMEFLGGMVNGLLDVGEAGVEAFAGMIEGAGQMVSTVGPNVLDMIIGIIEALGDISFPYLDENGNIRMFRLDAEGMIGDLEGMKSGMEGMGESASGAADMLRERLLENGLHPVRDEFNNFLADEVASARVHDMTTAMVEDLDAVGASLESLDGVSLDDLSGRLDTSTEAGAALDAALREAVGAMGDVQGAAAEAGESQAGLNERWYAARDALVAQLEALGYTREEAVALAEAYGAIPTQIETSAALETAPALSTLNDLVVEVDAASGTITVNGNETPADQTLGELIGKVNRSDGTVTINGEKYPADLTLEGYLGSVNRSSGTVDIYGNSGPADETRRTAVANIDRSSGTIDIYARVMQGAYGAVNAFTYWAQQQRVTIGVGSSIMQADGGAIARAGGGHVVGPGGPRDDLVPALNVDTGQPYRLSNGEHVLDADDVLDLGGQAGAYQLRAMIQAGMVKPLQGQAVARAGGGFVGGSSSAPAPTLPSSLTLVVDGRPMRAYIAEGAEAAVAGASHSRTVAARGGIA